MRVALLVLLSGCYAEHVRETCEGEAPDLGECFSGPRFADCGGAPGAQFACAGFECRWFAGSCLARGFVASTCPLGEICCGRDEYPLDGASFVARWGRAPWDATRDAALEVRVELGLPVSEVSVACSSERAATVCAPRHSEETLTAIPGRVEDIWRVDIESGGVYTAETLHLELVPVEGRIVARACHQEYSDGVLVSIPCTAHSVQEPWCADRGTITLDRDPFAPGADGLHGRGEIWFGDLRIDVAF